MTVLANVVLDRVSTPAPMPRFADGTSVLITGAEGSIGTEVQRILRDNASVKVWATDIAECDVLDREHVDWWTHRTHCDVVLHLAGAKHAPAGEEDPCDPLMVNAVGTMNVVESAYAAGARVVTASTCKACDPETAYGASKLLAERVTLARGGVVARFHNVVETQGNVFDLWRAIPDSDAITVADACQRYFISLEEAARLAIWCLPQTNGGRFCVNPGLPRCMADVATAVHPGRTHYLVAPRRGDRLVEPLHAACESWHAGVHHNRLPTGVAQIIGAHDQLVSKDTAA